MRRLYSIIPLIPAVYMLYTVSNWSLLLLPLALTGIHWHFFGMLYLIGVGAVLIYKNVGGVYGLSVIILALLAVELGQMDRERAPLEHYAVMVLSASLSIPAYVMMRAIAPLLPRLEITGIAVGIVLALYAFTKLAGES
ncbi:hypothetical protein [Thermococcus zilligii]|uniref:hypothetical protein n=1 Tax=Thermococcus zilligii TaxID=54076 RepID=UPI00029B5129|nr:hypothetical protein [Thermococcus zilligii]